MERTISSRQTLEAPSQSTAWLSIVLITIIHLSLATSLNAANWADGLHIGSYAVMLGVLAGTLLARTQWPRWFVRVYILTTGIALTLYLTSTLVPSQLTGPERPAEVLRRLVAWIGAVMAGTPSGDNLIFVMDVTFLLWWLSLSTTEQLLRQRNVWVALLPTGSILTINAYYASEDLTVYVLVYLAASLLLLVTTHLGEQMDEWSRAHVRYAPDISWNFLRNGLLFSLIVLFVAWMLPNVQTSNTIDRWLKPIRQPWHQVQQEWGRMFNALRYRPGAAIPTFGRTFNLRGAPNLTETPYFLIRAKEGRYWRSAVYDYYRGNGWDDTLGISRSMNAYENITLPAITQTVWLTQTVTPLLPGTLSLVAAPNPVRFSVPLNARVLEYPPQVGGEEILFAYAQNILPQGQVYSVISLVPNPDATSLRSAGQDYPQWIREHYLQLPDSLPERVKTLAQDIAAPFDTPYDRAKAVERYLRSIPYNENIPFPPRDRDAVDWFLFDLQQGYCDYYASAMVVMVRSLGIPARIASGYARGQFDEGTRTWTVRESDAHTWPELWFPGYGWVPFEPTPSEPPLERPEQSNKAEDENALLDRFRNQPNREPNIPQDEEQFGTTPPPLGLTGPLARITRYAGRKALPWMGVLLLGLLFLWQGWQRMQRRLAEHPALPKELYVRLMRWGRRLGLPIEASQTPVEQFYVLSHRLPRYRTLFQGIIEVYQEMLYAPPNMRDAWRERKNTLIEIWQHLRIVLWREWLRHKISHVKDTLYAYIPITTHWPRNS